MTPRSIRRAQERKANKLARKAEKAALQAQAVSALEDIPGADPDFNFSPDSDLHEDLCSSEPALEATEVPQPAARAAISPARLAANRANAQVSTGPRSENGKKTSSLNAVTTALTGRTVLLPSDDAAEYERHIAAYEKEFRPVGQRECDLVQSIADTCWRLKRIPALEFGIYALGRLEFADSVKEYDDALRPGMVEVQTFMKYEKQLRNLQLQEARLSRRREKETAELREMQKERDRREAEELSIGSKLYLAAKHDKKPFDPVEFGFEFSIEDIEGYLRGVRAAQIAHAALRQPVNQEQTRKHAA